MKDSLKKFLGNKNTVTIIGVLLAVVILWVGYNWRINQAVELVTVPYAKVTIQPRKEITADMVGYMNVAKNFMGHAEYYSRQEDIVGKFSNYNTIISEGSLFYKPLLIDKQDLPDSAFLDVPDGYTVINYRVNMDSTYANSMMPDDEINIYFKANGDDGHVMFGKFLSNIKIMDVKNEAGQHVFENTQEARTPAYMLFALPEDMHLLFRKALYMVGQYGVELLLVPKTQKIDAKDVVMVSSKDIQTFIESKTKMVSVDEILSKTADKATSNKKSTTTTTTTTTTNTTR